MNFSYPQIYLQEIPDELTLGISISGCNIKCKGCHSKETWNENFGEELTIQKIDELIKKNKHITCFLFFGGEWLIDELEQFFLHINKKHTKIKLALYSGSPEITPELIKYLDYYKVGPYIEKLGGVSSMNTNQRLYRISSDKKELLDITYKFRKD